MSVRYYVPAKAPVADGETARIEEYAIDPRVADLLESRRPAGHEPYGHVVQGFADMEVSDRIGRSDEVVLLVETTGAVAAYDHGWIDEAGTNVRSGRHGDAMRCVEAFWSGARHPDEDLTLPFVTMDDATVVRTLLDDDDLVPLAECGPSGIGSEDAETYLRGSCHLMAVALHRMHGWPIEAYVEEGEDGMDAEEDDDFEPFCSVHHVFAWDRDNGRVWDASGWRIQDTRRILGRDDLMSRIYDDERSFRDDCVEGGSGGGTLEPYTEAEIQAAISVAARVVSTSPTQPTPIEMPIATAAPSSEPPRPDRPGPA